MSGGPLCSDRVQRVFPLRHRRSLITLEVDADGDSQMRTSSSDEDEVDTLFPTANDPTDPQDQPRASTFMSELSPPASQDPPNDPGWTDYQPDDMDVTESHGGPGSDVFQKHVDPADVFGSSGQVQSSLKDDFEIRGDAEHAPGYAWTNKKAREEYQRALEQVVDRGFSLREEGLSSGSASKR